MSTLMLDKFSVSIGGKPVLSDISFLLNQGQRLGVVGRTGAGKSMLARAIVGLLPHGATPTGSLRFDDAPLPDDGAALAELRGKRIGLLSQDAAEAMDPLATAGAHIAEALTAAGETADLAAQTGQWLADVGLDRSLAGRYPQDLTAGERSRVMLAVALCGKPDLLIADEPLAHLDVLAQRQVIGLIDKLCETRQMSLLLIAHDLKLVALLCTRVIVLEAGRIVEAGDKADVFGRPKHAHTRLLMTAGRHRARTLMRTPIGAVLLEVRDVKRRFKRHDLPMFSPRSSVVALDGVSLSIRQGESMALIGPSGSGKTTLARIIAGLERATSGELEIDHAVYHGTDLPRIQRREISLVFPDPSQSFNPALTVGESIAEPLQLESQRLIDELSERMVEAVTGVGMTTDVLGFRPDAFSLPELQRLAIARALITRPRLIILDEPLRALDVVGRGELLVMLNRLRADFGLTFLVISQDLAMVQVVADRVLVMDKGRIVESGTPAMLFDSPQHEVTREMVAAALPDVGIVPVF